MSGKEDEPQVILVVDGDHDARLRAALEQVRQAYDAGDDDWRYRLLNTFSHYLRAQAFERRLIDPVIRMFVEEGDRVLLERRRVGGEAGTPKPLREVAPMAYAAAAVSHLRLHHGIDLASALHMVSKASGIDEKELRKFRNSVSRGRAPALAREAHESAAAEMRSLRYEPIDVLGLVTDLGRFVE